MSELNHEEELLNFINSKTKKAPLEYDKIFYLYSKIIKLSLIKTHTQFKSLQYSLSCLNMVSNIFFILLSYTNNSKLTMFLSERAIILFIEYINLSNDLNYYDDINLLDVKLFIYKKTIGPIKLNKKNNDITIRRFNQFSMIYKDLITSVFQHYIDNDSDIENIDMFITNIYKNIGNVSFEFFISNKLEILEKILSVINYQNLIQSLNLTSINLELYMYLYQNQYQTEKLYKKHRVILLPEKFSKNLIVKVKNIKLFKDLIKSI